jgi:hypothetical protein
MADLRSKDGYELRRRIDWTVEKECYIGEDGKVYQVRSYRRAADYPVRGLYVHPTNGILQYQKDSTRYGGWYQPRPWEREINYVSTEDGHWFVKDEHGDWYEHWIETKQVGDRQHERNKETGKFEPVGEVRYHTETKERRRELSHKEIVRLTRSPEFHLYGTNKNMLSRLSGTYIPAHKWKTA